MTQAAQHELKREKPPKTNVVMFCGETERNPRLTRGDIKPRVTRLMMMTDLMFSIVCFIVVVSCGERIVFFCYRVKEKVSLKTQSY